METTNRTNSYVLGLDMGTNSIGWSLVDPDNEKIIAVGSRIFSAGSTGDIDSGKDESNAKERREARQQRRQLWRRRRRKKKLFVLLQKNGLLPQGEHRTEQLRQQIIKSLDSDLKNDLKQQGYENVDHLAPYLLRKIGLEKQLPLFAFGRALYHLGQRRGFLSNRKQQDDKETGIVKKSIADLQNQIRAAGCRTVGQYFATLNPEETRIRERYTHRSMYEEEFAQLWNIQARFYPGVLSDDLRREIHHVLFFQRKLKNQKFLVGYCELEPNARRIAKADLLYQRFRYLQKVNDLTIFNEKTGEVYELSLDQRRILLDHLENRGDLTFKRLVKLLGLPKESQFNLGVIEKKLPGNKTAQKLRKIFGKKWGSLSLDEQEQVVRDVVSYEKNDAMKKRARHHWGLSSDKAKELANLRLEPGYGNFSRRAIIQLLPLLEQGTSLQTAIKTIYPDRLKVPVAEFLPPVCEVVPDINNPVVLRSLSQLRLIVNSVIKKYGKPETVRIELARSLKAGKKTRQERTKINLRNRKEREEARAAIILNKELGFGDHPPRWAIEKYLLAKECNWECPYTGKQIGGLIDLLGPESPFQVEHIIPRSRSMDNTFLNKTLCHHEFNIHVKGNKTPYELLHGNPDEYEKVLQRVRHFNGSCRRAKLFRFTMTPQMVEEQYEQFCERQLRDTAYASRLAARYLSVLFGGRSDDEGKLRVQVSGGQLTSILRSAWDLNGILGAPFKSRNSHRHHAIDALVTACAHPGIVQQVSKAFKKNSRGRVDYSAISPPWPGFYEQACRKILSFHVSHAVDAPVNGQFHEETNYGSPRTITIKGQKKEVVFYRKPVFGLSKSEVAHIVDDSVRKAVKRKIEELGSPKKMNPKDASTMPRMPSRKGSGPYIKKVRLWKAASVHPIGTGAHQRFVSLRNNHHIEIFAVLNKQGKTKKWAAEVVSLYEAMKRKREGRPIVNRDHGPGTRFLFSFVKGDCFRAVLDNEEKIFQVRMFTQDSGGRIRMIEYSDARKSKALKEEEHPRKTVNQLRKIQCQKVTISPLGELYRCNA